MALVAAVTAVAILGALAVGLAYTTVVDQRLTQNALAALQADALTRSGVAAAAVVLETTAVAGGADTLAAPWAQDSGRQPLGAGWLQIGIEDEARRLDLNAPGLAPAVPRLLALLGLDPALAAAIADWTDADTVPRAGGAERDWYLARELRLLPRDGPLASVGELAHVRGLDRDAVERLRPYVTVAGEPAVNPNTASREVLLAVLEDAALVERVLATRSRGALDPEALAGLLGDDDRRARLTARGQRYRVRVLAGVGDVRRAVEAVLWAPGGVPPEVISWRPAVPEPASEDAARGLTP